MTNGPHSRIGGLPIRPPAALFGAPCAGGARDDPCGRLADGAGDRVGERGFVLPLTVLALAVVGIALWSAVSVLDSARATQRDIRQRQILELAGARAEARVAFVLASEPLGPFGVRVDGQRVSALEELGAAPVELADSSLRTERLLRLDGARYRMPAGPLAPARTARAGAGDAAYVVVQLQDRGGLYNLNALNPPATYLLLRSLGVEDVPARRLSDSLADFVDPDDLVRLNGAERADYEEAGLPGPANWAIVHPAQALRALGWTTALTPAQIDRFLDISYIDYSTEPKNLNTATPAVLKAWFGIDDAGVARFLELREKGEVLTGERLGGLIGVAFDPADLGAMSFPARQVRVRVAQPGDPTRVYESRIELRPTGAGRPFFVVDRSVKITLADPVTRAGQSRPPGLQRARAARLRGDDLPDFPISQSILSWRGGLALKP